MIAMSYNVIVQRVPLQQSSVLDCQVPETTMTPKHMLQCRARVGKTISMFC